MYNSIKASLSVFYIIVFSFKIVERTMNILNEVKGYTSSAHHIHIQIKLHIFKKKCSSLTLILPSSSTMACR